MVMPSGSRVPTQCDGMELLMIHPHSLDTPWYTLFYDSSFGIIMGVHACCLLSTSWALTTAMRGLLAQRRGIVRAGAACKSARIVR